MAVKAGCGGNFEDGLCCRMVIETKRVFDGCAFTDENITLTLTTQQQIPQDAVFVSARIVSSEFVDFIVTNGNDGCSNVIGDIVMTFAVTYSSGGVLTTVQATHRDSRNVLLRLPSGNSLVPYSIEVQSNMAIGSGAIIGPNAVSVSGCLLQIIKVTAPVDILIPTYGYCKYPPCTGSVCPGIRTNVFPSFDE
ncbi:MAG: hypothetical protein J1G01_03470 [Clostridiales bacterium]|nr:hypothetical protein [Clostridiales bacterium]